MLSRRIWLKYFLHFSFASAAALTCFSLMHGCGKEDIESISNETTGSVPGKFVVRLAPAFRDSIEKITEKITDIVPGSDFLSRYKDDSSSFGLNGSSLLSDIYSVQLPDTGSDSVNESVFGKLLDLSDSDDNGYFENVDTDKYIANESYDPSTADDPDKDKQYYLDMINWEEAMQSLTDAQISAAAPVVVAVLDTGVQNDHEDLEDILWKDPTTGKVMGYDAISEAETSEPTDVHGHGSHVAGIIGGTGRNGKGIHGVGYFPNDSGDSNTEVMSIRVLNDNGAGTSEYMNSGIRWAVKKHLAQQEEDGRSEQKMILNMSLGGPFETDGYDFPTGDDDQPSFTDDMFEYAAANDVLIIVAAGNESCDISDSCKIFGKNFSKTYYYPCSYDNVLCVAASTHEDKLAGFSNRKASIGITAPGFKILSTVPSSVNSDKYAYYNGTSQATPVTAGAAAVLWAIYPNFSAAQIKAILRKSSARVDNITADISSGFGRLDLSKALSFASDLTESGENPLEEGEVDPATSAKSATEPSGGSGSADSTSDKIEGDTKSKQKCGTIPGAGPVGLMWLIFLPMLLILRRK